MPFAIETGNRQSDDIFNSKAGRQRGDFIIRTLAF